MAEGSPGRWSWVLSTYQVFVSGNVSYCLSLDSVENLAPVPGWQHCLMLKDFPDLSAALHPASWLGRRRDSMVSFSTGWAHVITFSFFDNVGVSALVCWMASIASSWPALPAVGEVSHFSGNLDFCVWRQLLHLQPLAWVLGAGWFERFCQLVRDIWHPNLFH